MENPERVYDATTWLGTLSVHQDFFWFASLLCWSLALLAWLRRPRPAAEWDWLPAAAFAAVAHALIEFGLFNPTFDFFQDRLVPGSVSHYRPALIDPYWLGDVLIGVALATTIALWSWQAAAGRRGWRVGMVAVAVLIAFMHAIEPVRGGVLLTLFTWASAFAWWRPTRGRWAARAGLILALALPVTSTVGPIAALTGTLQRSGPPTPMGLAAAAFQLALGGFLLAVLLRGLWSRQHPATLPAFRRDVRRAVAAGAVWLLAGLAFSVQTGRDNRYEIQENRLRAAAAQAKLFDPALLAPFSDPAFKIETRSSANEPVAAHSSWLAGGAADATQRQLEDVVIATPFLDAARILLIRDGWLVDVLSSRRPPRTGEIDLLRRATAEDYARWQAAEPYVESLDVHEIGYPYYCRAPIVSPGGVMLGWLDCVRKEYYLSVERRWRAGPFLITALGIGLLGLLLLQRQSAREREVARQDAEVAAAANRIKSAFLANVSHELRTPLQNILGYGELLERDASAAERARHLAALRRQGELMLRLVNDLIDLGAVEAGAFQLAPQPVAIARLVRETAEVFRARAAAKGLALDCAIAAQLPEWVEADEARVRQVLINLLGNAVKFTARGGVRLDTTAEAQPDGRWRVTLAVSDTGPGIPPAQQGQLFRPFCRLESTLAQPGSGLGLAVAAALCRAMAGEITVESDGTCGSRFVATLLVPGASAPAAVETATVAPPHAATSPRVLLVEDNRAMRELFVSALADRGAVCRVATTGAELRREMAREAPDVVLMDLALPDGDSAALIPQLRTLAPACRIVVVSAHASAAERARVRATGADEFLVKPVSLDALWRAVTQPGAIAVALPDYFATAPATGRAVREQFRRELSAWEAAAAAACAEADFAALGKQAHYLRSSAIAVGAQDIFLAAGGLEAAATAQDRAAVHHAWRSCQEVLRHWRAA